MAAKPETLQLRLDTPQNRERAANWALNLGKKSGVMMLATFAPDTASRSARQNRLWWKWMGIIGDHTGDDKRATDLYYRSEYLAPEMFVVRGEEYSYVPSSKDLKVGEMHELMTRVMIDASQFLELILPGPETQGLSEVFNTLDKLH